MAGFGMPRSSMTALARSLREAGHTVEVASLGRQLDCGERSVGRLLEQLPTEPVDLVGHSRGGQFARVLAVRHPERVRRLVTVGTPWSLGPPPGPAIALASAGIRAVRRAGVDLLPSLDCATAPCCERFRAELAGDPDVPWTAIWSAGDRVVGDDARPPAEAEAAVEVPVGHLALVRARAGLAAVHAALTRRE